MYTCWRLIVSINHSYCTMTDVDVVKDPHPEQGLVAASGQPTPCCYTSRWSLISAVGVLLLTADTVSTDMMWCHLHHTEVWCSDLISPFNDHCLVTLFVSHPLCSLVTYWTESVKEHCLFTSSLVLDHCSHTYLFLFDHCVQSNIWNMKYKWLWCSCFSIFTASWAVRPASARFFSCLWSLCFYLLRSWLVAFPKMGDQIIFSLLF